MARPRDSRARDAGHRSPSADALLFPLDILYKRAGAALPGVRRITPDRIPQPFRDLLVHENSMTLTLERHCGSRIGVRTLSARRTADHYLRRVLLVIAETGRPVEMGAARIALTALPSRVRARILRNEEPLGRILRDEGIDYVSRPLAFLAVTPNADLLGVFWMRDGHTLFGRRTEMIHRGRKIADVVEILPPSDEGAAGDGSARRA